MYWRRLRIAFEENCGNCPSKSPYIIFNRLFHSIIFPKRHFHDLWDLETHCAVIKKEPFQHLWINMVKGMILELYMPLSKNRLNDPVFLGLFVVVRFFLDYIFVLKSRFAWFAKHHTRSAGKIVRPFQVSWINCVICELFLSLVALG